ncbi:YknW family membrane protein [Aeribacillus alveayuensis]|uniref:Yip1 domain-containing protein n=1 Tax=Aeribacillus alveayuensis TaxID=279215 RepID=A0ABT9VMS0_9BACI|nr:hypothetical protein [Bacillus alveayuensis]
MEQQVNTNQPISEKPSLLGIITKPGETFERIREKPKVLMPLLFVIVLAVLTTIISVANADFVQMGMNQGLSQEEAEMIAGFSKTSMIIGGIISPPIIILISTLIYLAITKIAGTGAKFKQLFSMTTYISIITGIGLLLNAIIGYFVGTNFENMSFTSLNSLIGAEGATGALLSYIEVFGIWTTVLSAIGLHKVGKLSTGASWTIAIIFFIIGAIFMMISGFTQGMMGA